MSFTYDYTHTMMMKLRMATPNRKGGCKVDCSIERALEIIKQIDNMTFGVKKIIYLVGWQYLGHDDKYPAFFEVNRDIKRTCDNDSLTSLLWLVEEAKKYNTVVSLHINFTDVYEDSPLFADYVKANALIRTSFGKPAKIEKYNGKPCYKVSYKEEWESGLFKSRIDRLLAMFPLAAAGTVHVDNFQCYVNRAPFVSAQEMQYYRDKMIDYLREKGIDITSEFTYREGKGTGKFYGKITRDFTPTRYPIALIGKIPAVWWTDKMSLEEYFKYYPHVYGGGLPKNMKARNLFYGNVHGEEHFYFEDWQQNFLRDFVSINIPFFYLNDKQRVGFTDTSQREVIYSDGTLTRDDGTIFYDGMQVKSKNNVFLPFGGGYVVYSENGETVRGKIAVSNATLFEITPDGLKEVGAVTAENGTVSIKTTADKAYFIK